MKHKLSGYHLSCQLHLFTNLRLECDRQMWEFIVVLIYYKKSRMKASVIKPNWFPSMHIAGLLSSDSNAKPCPCKFLAVEKSQALSVRSYRKLRRGELFWESSVRYSLSFAFPQSYHIQCTPDQHQKVPMTVSVNMPLRTFLPKQNAKAFFL